MALGFASKGKVNAAHLSRTERVQQRRKGTRVTMGISVPKQSEGAVGDITVRTIGATGHKCYIKTNSGWYDINTMQIAGEIDWRAMTLESDWTADATFSAPAYYKDAGGIVHLRGAVDDQDTAVNALTDDITTLPTGFRPRHTIYKLVPRESIAEIQLIRIQSSGELDCPQAYTLVAGAGAGGDEIAPNTTKAVYFDGISFFAGKNITGRRGGGGTGGGESGSGAPG